MEEEVLGAKSADKSITDVATSTRVGIIRHEAWKGLAVLHTRHTATFQLLLAEEC